MSIQSSFHQIEKKTLCTRRSNRKQEVPCKLNRRFNWELQTTRSINTVHTTSKRCNLSTTDQKKSTGVEKASGIAPNTPARRAKRWMTRGRVGAEAPPPGFAHGSVGPGGEETSGEQRRVGCGRLWASGGYNRGEVVNGWVRVRFCSYIWYPMGQPE